MPVTDPALMPFQIIINSSPSPAIQSAFCLDAPHALQVFQTDPSKVPFPLIMGNIMDVDSPAYFVPVEFTPLYSGSPCNFSNPEFGSKNRSMVGVDQLSLSGMDP